MDFQNLTKNLLELGNNVYIKFDPEILDFTDKDFVFDVLIYSQAKKITLTIDDQQKLLMFLEIAKLTIFSEGNKILTWNWKNFVSFILGRLHISPKISSGLIDLKIVESYFGIKRNAPTGFLDALNRVRERLADGSWQKFQDIYKKIYIPLVTEVIPELETIGILNNQKVHAYYEINGQDNGRLLCSNFYQKGFIPHNLSLENKRELKAIDYNQIFMYFDFRSMEVNVLANLSGDEKLLELCQKNDVYSSIYEEITKSPCENRNKSKKIFLPIIYGQSAKALSESLNISFEMAQNLIVRIQEIFPKAIKYVLNFQEKLKENGFIEDFFGKKRIFSEGKEYRARNFAIQSPAALICLEKLVSLYYNLKPARLAYYVHDGYMIYATKENWKEIFEKSYDCLTSESGICPGLRLKVSCLAGRDLSNLKKISKKD